MKTVGLFGGTFDPIHTGHLILAEWLRCDLKLDEIWFIPSKFHPLKNNQNISESKHRVKMLELAIKNSPDFKVCMHELNKNEISFTVDTIRELKALHTEAVEQFYFFMGMDNVLDLQNWKNPDELLQLCKIVAFGRPDYDTADARNEYSENIQRIHAPLLEISSTSIRERVRQGRSIRFLVPEDVENYIKTIGLYT